MSQYLTSDGYGYLADGCEVNVYTLSNASGASLKVLTYGGIVTELRVPDRAGRLGDVVLGYDDLAGYVAGTSFFGAIAGRIAGRVTGGRLTIEGRTCPLALNNGANHLHGGTIGLDRRLWEAAPMEAADGAASLRLTYLSPDGEEGYPGNLTIAVTYTLSAANEFIIESEANTDCVTPLSLTHHSYFNLGGEGSGSTENHEIQVSAHACVPMDEVLTLSDTAVPVAGTAGDFTRPRRLGDALPQLFRAHGDLYLLRTPFAPQPSAPTLAARAVEPRSGRKLEVFTDESCLQFYTGAALDCAGKSGHWYGPHAGLCLECEGYPNGATHPEFGDILVQPGHPQRRRTIYAFSTVDD